MRAIKECFYYEMQQQKNSFFDKAYFDNLKNSEIEEFTVSEQFVDKLKTNAGLRLLLLANFHDATVRGLIEKTIYGKKALEFIVEFEEGANFFKKGYKKFRFELVKIQTALGYLDEIKPNDVCSIQDIKIDENRNLFDMQIDWFVFKNKNGFEDRIKITFEDVIVQPILCKK